MQIQLALDVLTIERAIYITNECLEHVDIIEVGTPLIHAEGLRRTLPLLRQVAGDKPMVVDTKTMDNGALESAMAFDLGASGIILQGAAPTDTLAAGLEAAQRFGLTVMIDGLGCSAEFLENRVAIGAGVIPIYHCGVDEQIRSSMLADAAQLARMHERYADRPRKIAIAGGIHPDIAKDLAKVVRERTIVIVGQYIAGSTNPAGAARRIRESLEI